jgi:hypothetical protein
LLAWRFILYFWGNPSFQFNPQGCLSTLCVNYRNKGISAREVSDLARPSLMRSPFCNICRHSFRLFCGSLLLLGCSAAPPKDTLSLKGKWVTADYPQSAYLSLYFADSTVGFDTRPDTVLHFVYRVDNKAHAVVLTDMLKRTVSCRVLKATTDTLIFANLWDITTPQRFVKE